MEENVPFEVVNNYPETGDLSSQTGGEVLEAARRIRFTIENVEPRIFEKDGTKHNAKLNVRVSIGPLGIDGQGRYAGKNMFTELLTWYNEELYTSDWWKNHARFPYSSFLKALDYSPATPPKVTDEFLISLKKREFIADIRKVEIRLKDEDGKYAGTGDFKNELANFKSIEE